MQYGPLKIFALVHFIVALEIRIGCLKEVTASLLQHLKKSSNSQLNIELCKNALSESSKSTFGVDIEAPDDPRSRMIPILAFWHWQP